jgi:hypothetical protein
MAELMPALALLMIFGSATESDAGGTGLLFIVSLLGGFGWLILARFRRAVLLFAIRWPLIVLFFVAATWCDGVYCSARVMRADLGVCFATLGILVVVPILSAAFVARQWLHSPAPGG